jgi:uncharacterized protein
MNRQALLPKFCLSIFAICVLIALKEPAEPSNQQKLRILIVTGGHDFEEKAFFQLFNEMEGVTWTHVRFQHDAVRYFKPENAGSYDVMVFYDMHQNHETHYQDWLKVLEKGKPSIFLHHTLGSYMNWDTYCDIVGGWANFDGKRSKDSPISTFKHDVNFKVQIADPNHPITKGLQDFEIYDETYNHFVVNPGVDVLLTTNHPTSGKVIAWTHRYKNSPVVYIQLGHGPGAYNNPNFRILLARSIRWAAEKK